MTISLLEAPFGDGASAGGTRRSSPSWTFGGHRARLAGDRSCKPPCRDADSEDRRTQGCTERHWLDHFKHRPTGRRTRSPGRWKRPEEALQAHRARRGDRRLHRPSRLCAAASRREPLRRFRAGGPAPPSSSASTRSGSVVSTAVGPGPCASGRCGRTGRTRPWTHPGSDGDRGSSRTRGLRGHHRANDEARGARGRRPGTVERPHASEVRDGRSDHP